MTNMHVALCDLIDMIARPWTKEEDKEALVGAAKVLARKLDEAAHAPLDDGKTPKEIAMRSAPSWVTAPRRESLWPYPLAAAPRYPWPTDATVTE